MDVLFLVGVIILAVVIIEVCGNRTPTVAHTDSWRQAVTGMIREPAAARFVVPVPEQVGEPVPRTVPETAMPESVTPGVVSGPYTLVEPVSSVRSG